MIPLILRWDAVPAEFDVTHYTVRIDDDPQPLTLAAEQCTTVCELRVLVHAGPHVFRLTATNPAGTSLPATVVYDVPALAAPTGLRIVPPS